MSLMNMMYKAQKDAKNLIIQDQTNKANIDYNANLAAAQAPLPRILDNKGKIDSNIISTIAPPPTFQEYLSTAQARMPKGVPINMAKVQEDYNAIVENFDFQAGDALAQAKQYSSDRRLVKDMQK